VPTADSTQTYSGLCPFAITFKPNPRFMTDGVKSKETVSNPAVIGSFGAPDYFHRSRARNGSGRGQLSAHPAAAPCAANPPLPPTGSWGVQSCRANPALRPACFMMWTRRGSWRAKSCRRAAPRGTTVARAR